MFVQKYCSIHLCFLGKGKLILFLLFPTHHGSLSMQAFTTTAKPKFKHSEMGMGAWSPLMANKSTGRAGSQVLVLPKPFRLSPWSEPHTHSGSPVCTAGILHPWESSALGLGSTKPKISTLEMSAVLWPQTSFSLWGLEHSDLSAPFSLLLCLHVHARDAQTAPKLT